MNEITDLFGNPDEEAMYQQALRVPLQEKIQMAIGLIQLYEPSALRLSDDGYYVCFSGGKDSIVMARLFEMAGVKYTLNYNNVTIDPPELVWFIKKHYPQTIWHSVGIPLPFYMAKKSSGPPTRRGRWCCEIYKEQGGTGLFRAIGVRAAESARRKGLWTIFKNDKRMMAISPILYWTDDDVWQFIRSNNMPYCSLYDEGFKRLGCIGCPMTSPEKRRMEFDRWPKHEKMWRDGFRKWWAAWHGVPTNKGHDRWFEKYGSDEEIWRWWLSESANDTDQPDCQMYLW